MTAGESVNSAAGHTAVWQAAGPGAWALAHLDTSLRFVAVDPLFRRDFGSSVLGGAFSSVVHPGFAAQLCERLDDLTAGRVNNVVQHAVMLRRDRTSVIVEMTAHVARVRGTACVVLSVRPEQAGRLSEALRSVQLSEISASILERVAAGVSTAEMAKSLCLSRHGVDYHVALLVRKLGASNRTGLVAMAYSAGVLLAGQWPPKVNPDLVV
ncbi:LuxR C-terminal-related transcriptional regulator [Lentzea sp. JNUCC 0626]|uniref:helix-turn-helix transcriptional regulator n=1 Tax=Lentzea sp. JNUCC 0626 TaxID=3367513 RepID=UPI00374A38AF